MTFLTLASLDPAFIALVLINVITIAALLLLVVRPERSQLAVLRSENADLRQTLSQFENRHEAGQAAGQEALRLTRQLGSEVEQQHNQAQGQASAVAQISDFIQSMSQTAAAISYQAEHLVHTTIEIKASTERVKSKVDEVMAAGEQGGQAIERTMECNQRVSEQYVALKNNLNQLEQKRSQINEVVVTIKTISDETHLLALNAAIEAAGAGVYGERFTVVANEVRALSNRAMAASGDINQKLTDIAKNIQQAAIMVESGYQDAQQAVEVSQEGALVMGDLVAAIFRNAEEVSHIEEAAQTMRQQAAEINVATNQHQATYAQAATALQDIQHTARQSVAGSTELCHNVAGLESLSQNLLHALKA